MVEALKDLFAADEAPHRDAYFRLSLMERIARRRLLITFAAYGAGLIAVVFCLGLIAPSLATLFSSVDESIAGTYSIFGVLAIVSIGGYLVINRRIIIPFLG